MSGVVDNARVRMLAKQLPFRVRILSNSVTLASALPLTLGPFWLMNQSDAKFGMYGMSAALSAP